MQLSAEMRSYDRQCPESLGENSNPDRPPPVMAVCWAGLEQPRRQLLGEAERSGRTTKDVYLQGKEKLLKRY